MELSGERDPVVIADLFLGMGVQTVIIKLGADGCLIRRGGETWRIPGFHVKEVLDTTGAGDAFCAGFLTGVTLGLSLPETAVRRPSRAMSMALLIAQPPVNKSI